MKKKKAQFDLGNLSQIILALVVAVIIIGVLASVLTSIQDEFLDTSTTKPNQTFTFSNNTEQGFISGRVQESSVVCYNDSHKINKGSNYSTTVGSITFINNTPTVVWCGGACINCSYSYLIGSYARNTTTFGLSGINNISGFIPTIAIIAISAIVIGIVLVMFGRRRP